jgi:molybdate transport system substrate-binding protein
MKLSSLTLLAGLFLPMTAQSAEVKILAGGSMTASLKELAPKFEQATGHRLDIVFAATPPQAAAIFRQKGVTPG